ncbi:MAG TPA: DinB family protein, partial [Streptosporangiaceae bacterium]
VPLVARPRQPVTADEPSTLGGLLEWHRATLLWKCAGLTGEQLARRPVPASSLSLLGLIRHLTDTERAWFRRRVGGQALPDVYARPDRPEAAFGDADPAAAQEDVARLAGEWELCRRAAAGVPLDATFEHERWGTLSVRWVHGHMIAEYARHLGHADLLRESIDGVTGQ